MNLVDIYFILKMGAEESKKAVKKLPDKELLYLTKASKLSIKEIDNIFERFSAISSDGQLNFEQFKNLYENIVTREKFDKYEKICEDLFRTFDRDQNQSISFGEFLIGYSLTTRGSLNEKLEYTFELYDIVFISSASDFSKMTQANKAFNY